MDLIMSYAFRCYQAMGIRPLSDVPEPDSEFGSGRILHYPVTGGLPGFPGFYNIRFRRNPAIPDIRIRRFLGSILI